MERRIEICFNSLYRSHAKCSVCSVHKEITAQSWTAKQIENSKIKNSVLVCQSCMAKGFTCKGTETYRCNACKEQQSRGQFGETALRNMKNRKDYILVCLHCREQEDNIVERLTPVKNDARSVRICSCRQPERHSDRCKVFARSHSGYNKSITLEELQFLHFRRTYVKRYYIQ